MKKILSLFLLLASSMAQAALIGSPTTKIVKLGSFTQYNGGDVYFPIENPVAGCDDGYWLTKSDPGFNANLAMLLSAYHAKSTVMVYGFGDQLWPGSSGKYCKMYSIVMQ